MQQCVMQPKKTGHMQHHEYIEMKNSVMIFTHMKLDDV